MGLKIGNIAIEGFAALAPMAGVADTAFRTICKQFGAAYLVGEMASSKGICLSDKKTKALLGVTDLERPFAVQLFGDDPAVMAEAARKAEAFSPDILDLNMGCPVPKVAGNGAGCALMKTPALAGHIIEAVRRAVNVPVTVKFRKGWDDGSANAVEFARMAESCGASAVTVHGRTREQMYAPPADWEIIAQVKANVHIPVIGNGDIFTPQDAKNMYEATGCDLVMVGRGALGAPWIFRQINEYLKSGTILPDPDLSERMQVMLRHLRLLCDRKGESIGMREARKHAAWYFKGIRGAACLRKKAGEMERYADAQRLAEQALKAAGSCR